MMASCMRYLIRFLFAVVVLARSAGAEQGMAIDPATCLGCHRDKISASAFAASVHGKNACTSCHVEIDLRKHMRGEVKVAPVQCERCHKKVAAEEYASIHAARGVKCVDCHNDIHAHRYWQQDKRIAVAMCIRCHDQHAVYRNSVHGR